MRTTTLIGVLIVVLGCGALASARTSRLYVCTADGYLLAIDGMTPGVYTRGSAGDLTMAQVHDALRHWTAIGAGNALAPSGIQVAVGSADAILRVYSRDLNSAFYNNAVSTSGNSITSIVLGDFGDLTGAIVVAHGWGTPDSRGSNALIFDNSAAYKNLVTLGNTVIQGMALADVDPGKSSNELILGSINDATKLVETTQLSGAFWNGTSAQVYFQHSPGTYVAGVTAGELIPGIGGDEWVQYGGDRTAANPTSMGDVSQAYARVGTNSIRQWRHVPPTPFGAVVDATLGDVMADPGLELVGVGNGVIYILEGQSGTTILQTITNGQAMSCLVLADVLGNDGVPEIVVGTRTGKLLAYQHTLPGDLSSSFVLAAELWLDPQGDGTEFQVTDMAAVSGDSFPCQPPVGDLNADCVVDLRDLALLSTHWGVDRTGPMHPFDMEYRADLAINALNGAVGPKGYPYIMAYLYPPYELADEPGVLCGEFLDGLAFARLMSGTMNGWQTENIIREAMYRQMVDGLGDSGAGDWIEFAGHKHLLPAFLTLHRLYPDDPQPLALLQESLQKFRAIALSGTINGKPYLYFPVPTQPMGGIGYSGIMYSRASGWPTPNMEPINTGSAGFEGVLCLPFAQYYQLTGDPAAADFLDKFIRFLRERATDFNSDGSFTKTDVVNGQVWSRMNTALGILVYGLAAGKTDLVQWARAVFDKAMELHGTRFGWLPENLAFNHAQGCETDTMTAKLEMALLLARKVDDSYWEAAERLALNQLLAQQVLDVSFLGNTQRLLGGFASFCLPNDWYNPAGLVITQSSHGSGMRSFYDVWYHTAWWEQGDLPGEAGRTLRINLHWSKNLPGANIVSYLPASTLLEITLDKACDLIVRKPDWADANQISAVVQPLAGGPSSPLSITLAGHWMKLGHLNAATRVEVHFPENIVSHQDVIHNRSGGGDVTYPYTTWWLGNAVIAISPDGSVHPNYKGRSSLSARPRVVPAPMSPYRPHYTAPYALDPIIMTPLRNTEDLRPRETQ